MIHIVAHARNLAPILKLTKGPPAIADQIRIHTYQRLFSRQAVPAGALVFTDFDLLQSYELDAAAHMANTVAALRPDLPILNHPAHATERFDLLDRLYRQGLNPVEVTRLSGGRAPEHYPVFLRAEDGWAGPETEILADAAALSSAVDGYSKAARPTKRRITVRYCAEPDADGYFRKYGAFVIGDRIVSQHIMRSQAWVVKHKKREDDGAFIEEEHRFCEKNPHQTFLLDVAAAGGIAFGRIDYGIWRGAPVVFEINLNPTFPGMKASAAPERNKRKAVLFPQLAAAFEAVNPGAAASKGEIATPIDHLPGAQFIEREAWYRDLPHSLLQRARWQRMRDARRTQTKR
ncbi:MAG: hypothetical protein AAFX45_07810 [Pseudomonadota bacterium]